MPFSSCIPGVWKQARFGSIRLHVEPPFPPPYTNLSNRFDPLRPHAADKTILFFNHPVNKGVWKSFVRYRQWIFSPPKVNFWSIFPISVYFLQIRLDLRWWFSALELHFWSISIKKKAKILCFLFFIFTEKRSKMVCGSQINTSRGYSKAYPPSQLIQPKTRAGISFRIWLDVDKKWIFRKTNRATLCAPNRHFFAGCARLEFGYLASSGVTQRRGLRTIVPFTTLFLLRIIRAILCKNSNFRPIRENLTKILHLWLPPILHIIIQCSEKSREQTFLVWCMVAPADSFCATP